MDFHFSGTHKSQVLCMVFFSPLINLENFSFSSACYLLEILPRFPPNSWTGRPTISGRTHSSYVGVPHSDSAKEPAN